MRMSGRRINPNSDDSGADLNFDSGEDSVTVTKPEKCNAVRKEGTKTDPGSMNTLKSWDEWYNKLSLPV